MVVIVIVGVLSAAAIPQFLGLKDRAEAGSLIGSMSGFAKECATGQITSTAAFITSDKLSNAGILTDLAEESAADAGDAVACEGEQAIRFQNSETFDASKVKGVVCAKDSDGNNAEATGAEGFCIITVSADGVIEGGWSETAVLTPPTPPNG